jgi:hypothetical protein
MKITSRTDRENFTMFAILKQLEMAGVDPKVLTEDKFWFSNNTISPEKAEEWKQWFLTEARKNFKLTKKKAEREFIWFNLTYGLREI